MSMSTSRPLPLADTPNVVLYTPDSPDEIDAARAIIRDYAQALGIDLAFQDIEGELAGLPGDYSEPRGALLLAAAEPTPALISAPTQPQHWITRGNGERALVAGCCALRPLDAADHVNAAEMKRLFVRPAFRGLGLGRQLVEAILDMARGAGYSCVLLDTLDEMETARDLYEDLGFTEVPPYYHNPVPGAHYLKVDL